MSSAHQSLREPSRRSVRLTPGPEALLGSLRKRTELESRRVKSDHAVTNKAAKCFIAVVTIDDKLSNEDIRRLWAKHFPKRLEDPKSKTLCLAFYLVVEERAARNTTDDEDLLVEVHEALNYLGIPRDEFYQVERENRRRMNLKYWLTFGAVFLLIVIVLQFFWKIKAEARGSRRRTWRIIKWLHGVRASV